MTAVSPGVQAEVGETHDLVRHHVAGADDQLHPVIDLFNGELGHLPALVHGHGEELTAAALHQDAVDAWSIRLLKSRSWLTRSREPSSLKRVMAGVRYAAFIENPPCSAGKPGLISACASLKIIAYAPKMAAKHEQYNRLAADVKGGSANLSSFGTDRGGALPWERPSWRSQVSLLLGEGVHVRLAACMKM